MVTSLPWIKLRTFFSDFFIIAEMLLSSPAMFFETEHTGFWFFMIWDLWLLMMVLPLQVHLRGRLWTLQFYANKWAFLHKWRGVLGSCWAAAAPYERIFPWVRRIHLHLCIVKILSVLASFINCTWHVMPFCKGCYFCVDSTEQRTCSPPRNASALRISYIPVPSKVQAFGMKVEKLRNVIWNV